MKFDLITSYLFVCKRIGNFGETPTAVVENWKSDSRATKISINSEESHCLPLESNVGLNPIIIDLSFVTNERHWDQHWTPDSQNIPTITYFCVDIEGQENLNNTQSQQKLCFSHKKVLRISSDCWMRCKTNRSKPWIFSDNRMAAVRRQLVGAIGHWSDGLAVKCLTHTSVGTAITAITASDY